MLTTPRNGHQIWLIEGLLGPLFGLGGLGFRGVGKVRGGGWG